MAKKGFTKVENTPFTNENYSANEQTSLMLADGDTHFRIDLTNRQETFCSFVPETTEDKARLFKAMNNPEFRVADCINKVIMVKDLFCEVVTCVSETGEETECPRIVLIDTEGTGYQAVSLGIYGALKKLIAVFGAPTWEDGLPVEVKQIKKGSKSLLTFDIAM